MRDKDLGDKKVIIENTIMKQTFAVVVLIVALLTSQSACATMKQQLNVALNAIKGERALPRPATILDFKT